MASISVIIATYNRAAHLDECLEHLRRQAFESGDEVIAVDNGSTDATATVMARHAASFPVPLRALHEPRPGKSVAVAAALAVARGDIVAFTDDDVHVTPDWLAAIRDVLLDRTIALAGGSVLPRWESVPPAWLRAGRQTDSRLDAPLALLDYGSQRCPIGERTLLGANMALQREVIDRVGGFAATLGKLRGTLLSGEDHDLCQRVQAAGLTAVYTPAARVGHWVPRQRMRLRYFLAWFFWSGITNAAMDTASHAGGRRIARVPAFLVRRWATALASLPLAVVRGRTPDAVGRAIDVAFATGYAAYQWGLVTVSLDGRA